MDLDTKHEILSYFINRSSCNLPETIERSNSTMIRLLRITGGIFFILLSLLGILLPIMPGWIFFMVGIILLSPDVPFLHRVKERIKARFPVVARIEERVRSACRQCI